MARKKQVNSKNGAVLNRDFPRRGRSLVIGAEELRRLFPNVKPEYIDSAIKRFGNYRFGDEESGIEVFGKILIAVMIQDALGTKEDGDEKSLKNYGTATSAHARGTSRKGASIRNCSATSYGTKRICKNG